MGPLASMDISTSGLTAYRQWMDVIAANIANMYSTATPAGGPYQPQEVVFQAAPTFAQSLGQAYFTPQGVEVAAVVPVPNPVVPAYSGTGGVASYPNVDLVAQMTDLIAASRAYNANSSAFAVEKSVETRALQLGQNA